MHSEYYCHEERPRGRISVIIPVWRESATLSAALAVLRGAVEVGEIIVSWADGKPEMMRALMESGIECINAGGPNRGRQMDLGAARATRDWLLFHHADTSLTPGHLQSLGAVTVDAGIVGGAFYRKFDERHPKLRFLEGIERWHNRTSGALYGDQSIFVRRDVFHKVGGFRGLPLMEDVDFSLRLRRTGTLRLLDPPIGSSPRKHLTEGAWRTTFRNAGLLFLYHAGVSPARLHALYYRHGASGDSDQTHHLQRPSGEAAP